MVGWLRPAASRPEPTGAGFAGGLDTALNGSASTKGTKAAPIAAMGVGRPHGHTERRREL